MWLQRMHIMSLRCLPKFCNAGNDYDYLYLYYWMFIRYVAQITAVCNADYPLASTLRSAHGRVESVQEISGFHEEFVEAER